MGWGPSSFDVRRLPFVNIFFSKTTEPIFKLTKFVCSICSVRRPEIINFMTSTPRGGNVGIKSVKLMYFLKEFLFSTPEHGSDKLSIYE